MQQHQPLSHMMLDIETLGLSTDTTVIAIGVVLFNPETGQIGPSRCYLPPINGQGGTIDFDTVRFWLNKNPALFTKYMNGSPEAGTPKDWDGISEDIAALLSAHEVDTIWANGIDFDLPILSAAFDRNANSNPLDKLGYRQRRDMRQWKFAAQHNGWVCPECPEDMEAHDALQDAMWQCRVVCSLWAYLSTKES